MHTHGGVVSMLFSVFLLMMESEEIRIYRHKKNPWEKFKQIDNEIPITEDNCQSPLGVANHGAVPRYRLQASDGAAYRGRLHQPKAWKSRKPLYAPGQGTNYIGSRNSWIQIYLLRSNLITGIQTQGDPESDSWVTWYYAFVSEDCREFSPIMDVDGLIARYHGNHDRNTVATNYFHDLKTARCVRIVPLQVEGSYTAMRLELLGCDARICKEAVISHLRADETEWPSYVPIAKGTASALSSGPDSYIRGRPYHSAVSQLDIDAITEPTRKQAKYTEFQFFDEKLVVGVVVFPTLETRAIEEHFTVNYSRNCLQWYTINPSLDWPPQEAIVFTREATEHSSVWFNFPSFVRVHCMRLIPRNHTHSPGAIRAHFIGCGTGEAPQRQCGRPKQEVYSGLSRRQKRVVGGQPLHSPFIWPWLVSLKLADAGGQLHHACGGSVLGPRWILTAAHCILVLYSRAFQTTEIRNSSEWTTPEFYERVFVTVGEHSLAVTDGPQYQSPVDKIVVSPEYNMLNFENDIALIRLTHAMTFTDQISSICLQTKHPMFDNTSNCEVMGWGKTEAGFPSRPHHVRVPLVDYGYCRDVYHHVNVTTDMLCAGPLDGSADSCTGDSGGPIVCESTSGQWVQVGIASWNIGCGYPDYPGVYARVAHFSEWIGREMMNNS